MLWEARWLKPLAVNGSKDDHKGYGMEKIILSMQIVYQKKLQTHVFYFSA